jgi:hypothetical protein
MRTFEDVDASALEHRDDLLDFFGVMVVVPEHRIARYRHGEQLVDEDARLVGGSTSGEVAADQQHVGVVGDVFEVRAEPASRVGPDVDVGGRGDSDHSTASVS